MTLPQPMSPILVLNSGSSSLKFSLLQPPTWEQLADGMAERLGTPEAVVHFEQNGQRTSRPIPNHVHKFALEQIITALQTNDLLADGLSAIGHRVVHGGELFHESTILNQAVLDTIISVSPLAPLHNPANVLGIQTAQALFPDVPHVAVFDTAFHQSLPPHAYLYAVPYELYTEQQVRRYGFHGTSHRYVVREAAARLERPLKELNFVSAHLGNGVSAAAVAGGRSVDTTLGLTPLEGLVMGTRSGDVDPALHLFLQEKIGWSLAEITQMLNKKSGLLGLSGLTNDMRTLLEKADAGHERSRLAIDIFCYRLAKAIAGLTVPLGRLDGVIFTGGIGEHAAPVRARVINQLGFLGLHLDEYQNDHHGRENRGTITTPDSIPALVIPTDEERMIAEDAYLLINQ